jgi:NitT/TauT family transport system substrate-binding protein
MAMKALKCVALAMLAVLGTMSSGAAQSPSPLAIINIATPGQDSNALAYFAQDMGFLKKHGIEAKFIAVHGSGPAIAAAVTGKSVDIGEGGVIDIAEARLHGVPLTLIAPSYLYQAAAPATALIVAKSSTIKTAKDLNGKTIGEPSISGPAKVATYKWLQDNGADPDSVKFIELPQPSMAAAVERGTVDAATINEPSLTPSLEANRIIGYPYSAIGKDVELTAWFATEDWVADHPALAGQFVVAMHEAALWANTKSNWPKSGAIVAQYTGLPPETVAHMRRAAYGVVFDVTMMQPFLDAANAQKSLSGHVDARSMISKVALVK